MQLTPKVKEILIGRNSFERPKKDALALLDEVIKIYLNEA